MLRFSLNIIIWNASNLVQWRCILNYFTYFALASSNIKNSSLNACWKIIWPYIFAAGDSVSKTEKVITSVITLSKEFYT